VRRRGQALHLPGRDQVHHQAKPRPGERRQRQEAEAAHLELSGDRGRRARQQRPSGTLDRRLIVGDQAPALIDQPQRQVRLPGTGRPAQEDGESRFIGRRCLSRRRRDAGGVDQRFCHRAV
jgi:hypothetical protein